MSTDDAANHQLVPSSAKFCRNMEIPHKCVNSVVRGKLWSLLVIQFNPVAFIVLFGF